jgi:hypothetical protein
MSQPTVEADLLPFRAPEYLRDPFPFYTRLRMEAPAYPTSIGPIAVSRYADVHNVLTERKFVKAGEVPAWAVDSPTTAKFLSLDMAFQTRDEHQRIRRAVNHHFTPKALAGLKARMEEIIVEDLDAITGESTFDVVEDFVSRFPVTVAGDMLGIDPTDRGRLYEACKRMGSFIEAAPSEADITSMERGFGTMMAFSYDLIDDRRRNPRPDDLLSKLVAAETPEKQLSDDELAALVTALFLGGFETTKGSVSNGIRALTEFPEEHRKLTERPELSVNATEEILRWDPVLHLEPRKALEPVTVAGEEFDAGTQFLVLIGSANRDEARHEAPEAFRVERQHDQRSHFTFGGGPYFCLGAAFSRMEMEIVFRLLPQRFKRLELVDIEFGNRPALRSPERMIVAVAD